MEPITGDREEVLRQVSEEYDQDIWKSRVVKNRMYVYLTDDSLVVLEKGERGWERIKDIRPDRWMGPETTVYAKH